MTRPSIIHLGRPVWGFAFYLPVAYLFFGGLDARGLALGLALIPYFGVVYWAYEKVVR